MPIIYNSTYKQFHLYNSSVSYLFGLMENGQLEQFYFGPRLPADTDCRYLAERGHRDMQPCPLADDPGFSPEHVRQEYPGGGTGDVRLPAYELERADGSRVTDFRYAGHRILDGKPPILPLPATYAETPEEAQTLEVTLADEQIHTRIVLSYTIFRDYPAVARHAEIFRDGEEDLTLEAAMSLSVDFPDMDYDMVDLAGAWSRERHVRRHPLEYGVQSVYSLRGSCSSHQFNPFLALARRNAGENSGEVVGLSLIYSGDFLAQAEVDNFHVTRLMIGIHPQEFRWALAQGESFVTPEAVLTYSADGFNGMSQTFHRLYRTRLANGVWRDRERPILLNSWEAAYFDFDEEKILRLAAKAAELGVELFVLDDGWFGHRDDATSSLGDWYPNPRKLPHGISGLAERLNALGLQTGLWIEPEMISEDSDLFRQHPDWVLGDSRRTLSKVRHQYLLDFSKPEVVDGIFRQLKTLLTGSGVTYIKWDHNRSMTEVCSQGADRAAQGKVRHRFILGMYTLYARLRAEFPEILFESCASGGARFDPGMLYFAPQAWTSDDTDAVERIRIQYGSSMVYPLSSMGSHVSAVPNEQVGRCTPLRTRAAAAYFGTFGYELDLTKLSGPELAEIRGQIRFMKQFRGLIQTGTFYRLQSPFAGDGNTAAWMVVSPDRKQALAAYFRILQRPEAGYERLPLAGLDLERQYEVRELRDCTEPEHAAAYRYGAELQRIGLVLSDGASGCGDANPSLRGDYLARMFLIRAAEA
jgi:alpha-galactosidase